MHWNMWIVKEADGGLLRLQQVGNQLNERLCSISKEAAIGLLQAYDEDLLQIADPPGPKAWPLSDPTPLVVISSFETDIDKVADWLTTFGEQRFTQSQT